MLYFALIIFAFIFSAVAGHHSFGLFCLFVFFLKIIFSSSLSCLFATLLQLGAPVFSIKDFSILNLVLECSIWALIGLYLSARRTGRLSPKKFFLSFCLVYIL